MFKGIEECAGRINPDRMRILKNAGLVVAGNFIFAVAVNRIIVPINLYNGGFTGIAQLIRMLLINLGVPQIPGIDYLGIIYYLINAPLFVLAYKVMGKRFCITSVISIGIASLAMAVVPVAAEPLLDDYLSACLVGGIVAGTGAGLVMRAGTSGGGQDIIGVALAKLYPNAKVGIIGIIINAGIYLICLFIYNIEIVVYSFIYSTVINLAIDRVFVQNINIQAIIFTKEEGVDKVIMEKLDRGVTRWEGEGAYTNEKTNVLAVMLSKYEKDELIDIVQSIDKNAFIMVNEGTNVYGNFKKKLTGSDN